MMGLEYKEYIADTWYIIPLVDNQDHPNYNTYPPVKWEVKQALGFWPGKSVFFDEAVIWAALRHTSTPVSHISEFQNMGPWGW